MTNMTYTEALRLSRGLDKTANDGAMTPEQVEKAKRIGTGIGGSILGGLGTYTLLKLIRPNLGWGATTAGTVLGAIGGARAANYIRDKMNEGNTPKESQLTKWTLDNPAKAVIANQAGKRLGKNLVKAGPDMLPVLMHPVDAAVGAGGKLFTNYLKRPRQEAAMRSNLKKLTGK